jgi:sRNA-binding carbon storage regulator CsrA
MLVLGVRENEVTQIGSDIQLRVDRKNGKLRVCLDAPKEVSVTRAASNKLR